MLLAGLSEFFIMLSVIYGFKTLSGNSAPMRVLYKLSLLVVLTASVLGAVKFLTTVNVSEIHALFTFISKNAALSVFIIAAGWSNFKTPNSKKIAFIILCAAFISLIANFITNAALLSLIVTLASLVFTVFNTRGNAHQMKLVLLAIVALIVSFSWGAFIEDRDLMIGLFHITVAAFFVFMARGLNNPANLIQEV